MIDGDFKYATGAAMIEWDSPYVSELKLLNEIAFERYQAGAWSAGDLFSLNNPGHATGSLHVGKDMIGEYFSRVSIGEMVSIGNGVNMVAHGGIEIGNNVRIGNNVQLLTVFHSLHPEQRLPIRTSPIIIGNNAVIADNALLVSSRKNGRPLVIGEGVHVLPDSVVIHDVHDGVVGGRPAMSFDSSEKILSVFHEAAAVKDSVPPFTSIEQARARLGAHAQPILPVSCTGEGNITSEGFYLLNCGSRLNLDGDMHVGKDVLIAHSVSINVGKGAKLIFERNVWCGAGVEINVPDHQSVTIGHGAVIAAGATVTRDVPSNSVVTGNDTVKKTVGDADYDRTMPAHWMEAANCVPGLDAITQQKAQLSNFAVSPQIMATRIGMLLDEQESFMRRCAASLALKVGHPF